MSYHLQIIAELRKLIEQEAEETAKIVLAGLAFKDLAAYKEYVGRYYAFQRSLELFEQAAEIVEKSV